MYSVTPWVFNRLEADLYDSRGRQWLRDKTFAAHIDNVWGPINALRPIEGAMCGEDV